MLKINQTIEEQEIQENYGMLSPAKGETWNETKEDAVEAIIEEYPEYVDHAKELVDKYWE